MPAAVVVDQEYEGLFTALVPDGGWSLMEGTTVEEQPEVYSLTGNESFGQSAYVRFYNYGPMAAPCSSVPTVRYKERLQAVLAYLRAGQDPKYTKYVVLVALDIYDGATGELLGPAFQWTVNKNSAPDVPYSGGDGTYWPYMIPCSFGDGVPAGGTTTSWLYGDGVMGTLD